MRWDRVVWDHEYIFFDKNAPRGDAVDGGDGVALLLGISKEVHEGLPREDAGVDRL